MKKPIFVTRPFFPSREVFDQYVDQIWQNKWMTNQGPLHESFKDKLKSFLGVENVTLTVNGHMALEVALRGLRIRGEVITTPFTFASTVHSIALSGMTPVFCDINKEDLTIDVTKIEELITEKTVAILPVHVYGHPCDTEKINQIAIRHNLKVLYDAAHAFGVEKNGVSIAREGDASIFSFHATKLFNTIEGGAIVFKDDCYKNIFDMYKNFGIENEESIPYIGGNAKMNEFQAAMGLANLQYFGDIISERKQYTDRYRERLSDINGIRYFVPDKDPSIKYNYAYLPVCIEKNSKVDRNQLYNRLKEYEIYTRKYFYPLLSDCSCYRYFPSSRNLSTAQEVAKNVLTLPLYYGMGIDTVDYVCDKIQEIMND